MMSLKTWSLLVLTVPLAVAEVVDQVSDCPGFLLDETPPEITGVLEGGNIKDQNRYKIICQTYQNLPRFLTLYDTTNKIPVFSAYKYIGEKDKGRPTITWMTEPQLEDEKDPKKNMMSGQKGPKDSQAKGADYKKSGGYDIGHLFPNSHGSSTSDKKATFTLTNAVPQAFSFNRGSWNQMEADVKGIMLEYCTKSNQIEGFVIVGAEPSQGNSLKNGVNIPSILWSAFCCYSSKEKGYIAGAYWGDNDNTTKLQMKTLRELQDKLKKGQVFHQNCPLDTKFDPDNKGPAPKRPAGGNNNPTGQSKKPKKPG